MVKYSCNIQKNGGNVVYFTSEEIVGGGCGLDCRVRVSQNAIIVAQEVWFLKWLVPKLRKFEFVIQDFKPTLPCPSLPAKVVKEGVNEINSLKVRIPHR